MKANRHRKSAFSRATALLLCLVLLLTAAGCGNHSGDDDEVSSELSQQASSSSSTSYPAVEDTADFSTGRFVETAGTAPPSKSFLNTVILRQGSLLIQGRDDFWTSEDDGDTWEEYIPPESELVKPMVDEGFGPEPQYFFSSDGTVLIAMEKFHQFGDSDLDYYYECRYVVVEPDGSEREIEIRLPAYELTANTLTPIDENAEYPMEYATQLYRIMFLQDGSLVGMGGSGDLYHIDVQTGEVLHTISNRDKKQWPNFAATSNTILLLFDADVRMYDLETWEERTDTDAINEYLVGDGELSDEGFLMNSPRRYLNLCAGVDEEAFYFLDDTGVYRYMPGGVTVEKLVESSVTSLGIVSLTCESFKVDAGHNFYALFSEKLAGASSEEVPRYSFFRYTYDEDTPLVQENTLKVWSLYHLIPDDEDQMVGLFQRDHPDIRVEVEFGIDYGESGFTDISDAQRKLVTEIMAGNGPDVIVLDDMPVETYQSKGILADITDVVEELDGEYELLRNITDLFAQDGRVYAVPAEATMSIAIGDPAVLDKIHDVDSMVETFRELRAENPGKSIVGYGNNSEIFSTTLMMVDPDWIHDGQPDWDMISHWFDQVQILEDLNSQDVENPLFVDEEGVTWFTGPLYEGHSLGLGIADGDALLELRNLILGGLPYFYGIETDHPEFNLDMKLLGSGEIHPTWPTLILGVNAKSEKQDLAKDFVKMVLRPEMQMFLTGGSDYSSRSGLPANFTAVREYYAGKEGATVEDDRLIRTGPGNNDLELLPATKRYPTAEEIDWLKEQAQKLNCPFILQERVVNMALSVNYYNYSAGEKTKDEALKDAQDKIDLYLAEK